MSLAGELRRAARLWLRTPGATFVAVAALAFGIGSTTVTFSLADAYLLRPLPFPRPDRLLHVWSVDRKEGSIDRVSVPDYLDWRERTTTFADLAAFNYTAEEVVIDGPPERIQAGRMTANALRVLGRGPALGRDVRDGDDRAGAERVAILTDAFWRARFGGSPAAIGRTIRVGGELHTIVGVMPADFVFPLPDTEFLVPYAFDPLRDTRARPFVQVFGRLRDGVSEQRAAEDMSAIAAQLAREHPEDADRGAQVVPLRRALNFAYDVLQIVAAMLFAANALVLLIVCANVASLVLGNALHRAREFAIRSALGATRRQIVRLIAIDSLVLAVAGVIPGVLFASWWARVVAAQIPPDIYRVGNLELNGSAAMFAAALGLAAALGFGVLPALRLSKTDLVTAFRDGGAATLGQRSLRLQHGLVIVQVAFAIALLASTLLIGRGFQKMQTVDPGFEASDVMTMKVILPDSRYPDRAAAGAFHRRVIEQARRAPGVVAAATVNYLPLNHESATARFEPVGSPPVPGGREPAAELFTVGGEYFAAMRVPLMSGRVFQEADDERGERVAIVNRTLAERYWPNDTAIERRIRLASSGVLLTIVGVVGDVRHSDLSDRKRAQLYLPQAQAAGKYFRVIARSAADPTAAAPALAAAIREVDPELPVSEVRPLQQVVDDFLTPQRAMAGALARLGAVATLLATLGVYGLMTLFVARRTREIGIRVALGATRRQVVALVAGRGLRLVAAGSLLGGAAAAGLGQILAGQLFGVTPTDPVAVLGVPLALTAVAMTTVLVVARRASGLNPVHALRQD